VGAPLILAQFSTRLPPELLERLRIAAPQLGMRQSDIAAVALNEYLRRCGF
jgi:predicted DNA-binding protein